MKVISDIVNARRREILILWGIFVLWAFSVYVFRYNHAGEEILNESWGQVLLDYVLGFLQYMIGPYLVSALLIIIGYIVGRSFLELILKGFSFRNNLEESLFSIGTGLGIVAIVTFLLGLMKLLYVFIFAIIGIVILAAGFRHIIHLYKIVRDGLKPKGWSLLDWALFFLLTSMVLVIFFRCCNPSSGWDALNSHLAAPKFYLREHAVRFFLWIKFNNFPQILEMLTTIQMMVFKDPGSSLVFLYNIGIVLFTYLTGVRYFNRQTGLIAGCIYMLNPLIYRSSQGVFVELVLVFYAIMLLYAALAWFETRNSRWLVLAGIAGGLACGVKYLGLPITLMVIVIVVIGNFLKIPDWERKFLRTNAAIIDRKLPVPVEKDSKFVSLKKKKRSKAVGKAAAVSGKKGSVDSIRENYAGGDAVCSAKDGAAVRAKRKPLFIFAAVGIFVAWVVIFASPWYLRNIMLFANPFFPFFETVFGSLAFGTMNDMKSELGVDHSEMLRLFGFDLSFSKILELMWDTTFVHDRSSASSSPNLVGPMILALTPAVLFIKKWRRIGLLILMYVVMVYAYWFLYEKIKYMRYILYVYPAHAILIAWGLSELYNLRSFNFMKRSHLIWVSLIIAALFIFWINVGTKHGHSGNIIFFTEQARWDYYDKKLSGWPIIYEVNEAIAGGSNVLTKDTIIYGLGAENRRYLFDCPLIGDLHTYASYGDLMEHANTGEELYHWLKIYDTEFLYFSQKIVAEFLYLPGITLPDDPSFEEYFEVIARYEDFELFRLVAPGEPRLTEPLAEIPLRETPVEPDYTP